MGFFASLLLFFPWILHATFIPNVSPRVDTDGKPMDIHDGKIVKWGEEYFWYGVGYGACQIDRTGTLCAGVFTPISESRCGFQVTHKINIYSSKDLLKWDFRGEALLEADRPRGIYFRPKVVFNTLRQKYVLWVNFLSVPEGSDSFTTPTMVYPGATYIVAESDTAFGPFTILPQRATMKYTGPGDFDIIVEGAEAFIAYTAYSTDHRLSIERLNGDFTDSTKDNLGFLGTNLVEAPAFFKHENTFFLTFGHSCCFCYTGSNARVYTSDSLGVPTSMWIDTNVDIGLEVGSDWVSFARAQQSFVFEFEGTLIWAGDQWGLTNDGSKANASQIWVPMHFDGATSPSLPMPLQMVTGFDTEDPLNTAGTLTGFCGATEVPTLFQLNDCVSKCSSDDYLCIGTCMQLVSEPCRRCLYQRGAAAMLCIPPDYLPPSAPKHCAASDVFFVVQLVGLYASPIKPPNWEGIASQLMQLVTESCHSCLLNYALQVYNIPKQCIPAEFFVGACSIDNVGTVIELILCESRGCSDMQKYGLVAQLSGACQACLFTGNPMDNVVPCILPVNGILGNAADLKTTDNVTVGTVNVPMQLGPLSIEVKFTEPLKKNTTIYFWAGLQDNWTLPVNVNKFNKQFLLAGENASTLDVASVIRACPTPISPITIYTIVHVALHEKDAWVDGCKAGRPEEATYMMTKIGCGWTQDAMLQPFKCEDRDKNANVNANANAAKTEEAKASVSSAENPPASDPNPTSSPVWVWAIIGCLVPIVFIILGAALFIYVHKSSPSTEMTYYEPSVLYTAQDGIPVSTPVPSDAEGKADISIMCADQV